MKIRAGTPFSELDEALARAAEEARAQGLPALWRGRRVLLALVGHPQWPNQAPSLQAEILQQGGGILLNMFKHTGRVAFAAEAADFLREALDNLDVEDPRRPFLLSNLGVALRNIGIEGGDDEALNDSIAVLQAAVGLTGLDDVERPRRLSNLNVALRSRYDRTGDEGDLNAAIAAMEEAFLMQATADLANNLAIALHDRHARAGRRADLERAIELAVTALGATPPQAPLYGRLLANLGLFRGIRYQLDGGEAEARAAVEALYHAAELAPSGSADQASRLCNLANQYVQIFERSGNRAALAAAADAYASAMGMRGLRGPARTRAQAGLASAFASLGDARGDTELLRRAVALARSALRRVSPESSQRAIYANTLANALRSHGRSRRSRAMLTEAIDTLDQELGAAASYALFGAKLLVNKAHALADLFELTRDPDAARAAAEAAADGSARLRIQAVAGGVQTYDFDLAAKISLRVAGLLAQIGDALAAAAMAESARTVRFNAEAARLDDRLVKDTEVSSRWRALQLGAWQARLRLQQSPTDAVDDQVERSTAASVLGEQEEQLASLLTEHALQVEDQTAGDLQALAEAMGVALVYVFETGDQGHALIVMGDRVLHVSLPDLTTSRGAGAVVSAWLSSYAAAFGAQATEAGAARWAHLLVAVLDWVGVAFAAPVEAALRAVFDGPVVLLPSGTLALAPLHAAPIGGGELFSDSRHCDYAPSAALLRAAWRRLPPDSAIEAFGDAHGDLPFARLETYAAAAGRGLVWVGQDATRDRLISGLARASRTHLAIHARFDPGAPLESSFLCAEGETLLLGDVLSGEASVCPGATVIASACETGAFETAIGSAEQVGFAAALLARGARRVVATLWPVADLSTAAIMARTTALEAAGQPFDSALHAAVRWLRGASGPALAAELAAVFPLDQTDPTRLAFYRAAYHRLATADGLPFAHPRFWSGILSLGASNSLSVQP